MLRTFRRSTAFPWLWVMLLLLIGLESCPRRLTPTAVAPRMKDACGRAVTLPRDIQRAGLLTPTLAEYLFVTRAPDPISKGFAAFRLGNSDSLLGHVYAQLAAKRSDILFANGLNEEALLAERPDVVFDWSFRAPSLGAIGLPAVCLSTLRNEEAGLLENARIYADALMQPGRVGELKERYRAAFDELSHRLGFLPKAEPVRVLSVSINDSGRLNAVRSPLRSQILKGLGDRDVRDELPAATSIIDAETILALDPDVIVLDPDPFAYAGPTPTEFMRTPMWAPLKAVRTRRVYDRPLGASGAFVGLVETPLFAQWMAELLHPDLAPDLRDSMRRVYGRELHYAVSEAELDNMLAVARNRQSAGYRRFSSPASVAPPDAR